MKSTIPFVLLAAVVTLFMSSCSNINRLESTNTAIDLVKSVRTTEDFAMPEPYTLTTIRSALEEYMNYRLWLYPAVVESNRSSKSFDPYIGKKIAVEVRVYVNGSGDKQLYALTSIDKRWLAEFKTKNGIVYCDGQVSQGDALWPEGSYEVIGTFDVSVQEPHKPNYGTSERKDRMIAAALQHLNNLGDDLISGEDGDQWTGAAYYLDDFYEYEDVLSAWLVRTDGYVWSSPLYLTEENGEFEATGMKGFGIKDMNELDPYDLTRYIFDKGVQTAVRSGSA